ncbi:MAG: Wzz/FepE/Etk N-terminal domain-containing protein [Burkholderiaceae bacterium]|nr:Wzz/FepE/Etk N-terminal domain-containing protein [Burkholderiaceae bacterium]
MNELPQNTPDTDDEISLLDLALTVAENLRLLIIAPMVVGLAALGVSSFVPKTFESRAVLSVPSESLESIQSLAALPTVLESVAARLGLDKDVGKAQATYELKDRVGARAGRNDGLLTVTAKAESAEAAQQLTQAVVAELFKALELKGERKAEVERALALARQAYANNALVVQRASRLLGVTAIDNTGNTGNAGNAVATGLAGYAQLVSLQQALSIEAANYERELRGLDESDLLQAATLPTQHVAPRRAFAATLAALATGFALLLFIFVRKALVSANQGADRLAVQGLRAALRRAVGLRV